jgi:hypothetical protein
MIEIYPLEQKCREWFPERIWSKVAENLQPLSGLYRAYYATRGDQIFAAGGARKNEEGNWVAWIWVDRDAKTDGFIWQMRRWARRIQREIEEPLWATVSLVNPKAQRLAKAMQFRQIAVFTHLEDRTKSFGIWKREY